MLAWRRWSKNAIMAPISTRFGASRARRLLKAASNCLQPREPVVKLWRNAGERRSPSLHDRCGWTRKTAFSRSVTATYNTSNRKKMCVINAWFKVTPIVNRGNLKSFDDRGLSLVVWMQWTNVHCIQTTKDRPYRQTMHVKHDGQTDRHRPTAKTALTHSVAR